MSDKLGALELNQIYTGDARELAGGIPDGSIDLVLTDPPFGIGFKYSNGYDDDPEGYHALISWLIAETNRVLKPGGMAFVYQAMKRLRETWLWFPEDSRIFASAKNFTQLNREEVTHAYEPVIFWKKPGGKIWRKMIRDFHVANTANTQGKDLQEGANDMHSCPRHIDTIVYIVNEACAPGSIVCDFFMGSGTTALAAKITGRQYIGFEIDPPTAQAARDRIQMARSPLPFIQATQSTLL